jgi:hypothetical protein
MVCQPQNNAKKELPMATSAQMKAMMAGSRWTTCRKKIRQEGQMNYRLEPDQ